MRKSARKCHRPRGSNTDAPSCPMNADTYLETTLGCVPARVARSSATLSACSSRMVFCKALRKGASGIHDRGVVRC